MWGIAGSHHPQWLDALARAHAVVEDRVRAGKAMGLRNLPSKNWTVNSGWMLAANLGHDLDCWLRLLTLHDQADLARAEPDTMRYRPARPAGRPRPPPPSAHRTHLALGPGVRPGLAAPHRPARSRLKAEPRPPTIQEGAPSGPVEPGVPAASCDGPAPTAPGTLRANRGVVHTTQLTEESRLIPDRAVITEWLFRSTTTAPLPTC